MEQDGGWQVVTGERGWSMQEAGMGLLRAVLLFGLGMSALGAGAAFNWADGPRWQFHPWEGWLLGGIAGLVAGYFFVTAMQGWRRHHSVTQH